MNLIQKKVNFEFKEEYLPTPRCRKQRERFVKTEDNVTIRSISSEEAPVAFILKDWTHRHDLRETPVIRKYNNCLYQKMTQAYLYCRGKRTPVKATSKHFAIEQNYCANKSRKEELNLLQKQADNYIVIDGYLWHECGEPRYVVMTFGLGHNHGGTALMVTNAYNSNICKDRYFNALQGKEAIAEAKRIAKARGDTESLKSFKASIQVVDQTAVKCNPSEEHGKGNPFLNTLETISENSRNITEAGLLAIATALQKD